MIRYKLTERPPKWPHPGWKAKELFVILKATQRQQRATPEFEGDAHLLLVLAPEVEVQGSFDGEGHYWMTPDELRYALFRRSPMDQYEVELLEGAEIFENDGWPQQEIS